jgi:hypothetical protein
MSAPELVIHTARLVTDQEGMILNNKILHFLQPGMFVRISYYVKNAPSWMWTNDSPYVELGYVNLDDNTEPNELGGYIAEQSYRDKNAGNRDFPFRSGEYIKFTRDNIIEIWDKGALEHTQLFDEYRTEQTIPATGPLYTVEWEFDEIEELDTEEDKSPENSSEED